MATQTKVDELWHAFLDARARGETPSPEDLCRDCPDLLSDLRCRIVSQTPTGPPSPQTRSVPVSVSPGASTQPDSGASTSTTPPGMEPVPGYTLVRQLGKGGFGEVWEEIGRASCRERVWVGE